MFVLITYDVNTEDADGKRRLRQIAKQCVDYGQRVQNSVFECMLDSAQCRMLKARLCAIMDKEKDSLRFYYLGKNFENKIEHFGAKSSYLPVHAGSPVSRAAVRPAAVPAREDPPAAHRVPPRRHPGPERQGGPPPDTEPRPGPGADPVPVS